MGARRVARRSARRLRREWRRHLPTVLGVHDHLPVTGSGAGVALTFDDGPDARFTPLVLDVLAERGTLATFFLVGEKVARQRDLVARVVAEGHAVGSHGQEHRDLWDLPTRELADDIRRGKESLEDVIGERVALYRPAKGHLDVRVGLLARRHRLHTWLWNVDPQDWRPGATAGGIVAAASARPGDVVLLHDGLEQPWAPEAVDRSATVEALPRIIAACRAAGADLVVLPT